MTAHVLAGALIAAVAGAVLSLDRTAAFQVMVSRPLVAAPVIGFLLGDTATGLLCGTALELLFIGDLPVGKYIPVNDTALSVLVTAVSVTALEAMASGRMGARGASGAPGAMLVFPMALLASVPASVVFRKADSLIRGLNARFHEGAFSAVSSGSQVRLMRENLKGAGAFFLGNLAALVVVLLPLTVVAWAVFSRVGAPWCLYPAFAGSVALGIAAALNAVETSWRSYAYSLAGAGAALAILVMTS